MRRGARASSRTRPPAIRICRAPARSSRRSIAPAPTSSKWACPFSDPLADGPVIQRATERALAAGGSLRTALALIAEVRPVVSAPIVVFTYANPLLRLGLDTFARQAAEAGVDGVLALDLPIEEAGAFRETLAAVNIDTIFLLSPTTTDAGFRRPPSSGAGFCTGSRGSG